MGHHGLPEGKAGHFRVWFPVEDLIKRMIHRLFFRISIACISVQVQRQARHGLRQKPDTGIHRGDLHGGLLVHPLPGACRAKEKGLSGVSDIIRDLRQTWPFCLYAFRRAPGLSEAQPTEKSHRYQPL